MVGPWRVLKNKFSLEHSYGLYAIFASSSSCHTNIFFSPRDIPVPTRCMRRGCCVEQLSGHWRGVIDPRHVLVE